MTKMNLTLNAKKMLSKMLVIALMMTMLMSFAGCDETTDATITTSTTTSPATSTTVQENVAIVVTDENGGIVTDKDGVTVTSIVPANNVTTRTEVVIDENGATRTEVYTMPTVTTIGKAVTTIKVQPTNSTLTTTEKKNGTTKGSASRTTIKSTTKAPTTATVRTTTTTKATTRATTKTTKAPTTTTQAHTCSWTNTDYKSPAVGVNGYYKYVCNGCGDTWTKDLPGFSYGTATPSEVQAYANQYLENRGASISYSVSPWNTACGHNSPMAWGDGQSLASLIPYIENYIEYCLSSYGVNDDCSGEPIAAYAEVPRVVEGVTHYDAGDLYICFY